MRLGKKLRKAQNPGFKYGNVFLPLYTLIANGLLLLKCQGNITTIAIA